MSFSTLDYGMQRRPSTAPSHLTNFGISDFANSCLPQASSAGVDDSYFAFNVPQIQSSNNLSPAQSELFGQWTSGRNPMLHHDSGYFSQLSSSGTPAYETEIPHLSSAASTTSTTHSDDSPRTPKAQELPPSPPLPAKKDGTKISRPPNAWILYRSDKLAEVKEAKATVKTPQAELSKMIAERWRAETPEVKRKYDLQAQLKKQEHDALYPGYKFKPRRKGEKTKEGNTASPKTRTPGADRTPRIRNRPQTAPGNRATRSSARTGTATSGNDQAMDGQEGVQAALPAPKEEPKSIPEVKAQLNAIWNSNEEQIAQNASQKYQLDQPFSFQPPEPRSILFPEFSQPSTSYQFPTLTQPALPSMPNNQSWFDSPAEVSLSSPAWSIPTVFGGDFAIPFNQQSTPAISQLSLSPEFYNEIDSFPSIGHQMSTPSYPTPAELEMLSPFVPPSPNYQFPPKPQQQEEPKPDWWPHRHVRVKRADSGIELQELLRQLQQHTHEMEL